MSSLYAWRSFGSLVGHPEKSAIVEPDLSSGATMSLSDLASIGSFISGVAVLVSLIYLALQVRQAEKNQRAIVQQERVSRSSDQLFRLADPVLARAWLKGLKSVDDLTDEEAFQFTVITTAMLRSVEDAYFQHKLGLLDPGSLNNQVSPLRGVLTTASGAALWKSLRRNYDESFAKYVDSLVPPRLGTGLLGIIANWRTEFTNMTRAE